MQTLDWTYLLFIIVITIVIYNNKFFFRICTFLLHHRVYQIGKFLLLIFRHQIEQYHPPKRYFMYRIILSFSKSEILFLYNLRYHEDLEKREGVWCGGAQKTQEPRVTLRSLLSKENIFSNLPAFQDLNGRKR